MGAYNNSISLTQTSSGTAFELGAANIISVSTDHVKITYNTLVGVFQVGEKVSGGTSLAIGQVLYDNGTYMLVRVSFGTFQAAETITGATSAATCASTAVALGSLVVYQDQGAAVKELVVDESPTLIYQASDMLVALTLSDSSVQYININNIIDIVTYSSGSINAKVYYQATSSAAMSLLQVQETKAALHTAINALITGAESAKTYNPVAINATATATAAQIAAGYITSTSAAATAITTPTATAIAAAIGGAARGTIFDFFIDNSAGASTVTLTLDASIAVVTPAITGGATLTVSTANAIGQFRLVFTSATAAKIFRVA